jgi:hypothetical protein
MTSQTKTEALQAMRFAGWVLLGLATTFGLLAALAVFIGVVAGSRTLAIAILVIASSVILWTMERWIQRVWGLFALAAFNSFIMATTGHQLNTSAPVSRTTAVLAGFLFLAISFLLARYPKGNALTIVERVTLLSGLISVVWSILVPNPLIATTFALGMVATAYLYSYLRKRPVRH